MSNKVFVVLTVLNVCLAFILYIFQPALILIPGGFAILLAIFAIISRQPPVG